MTEAEWLACPDPQPMLEFLRGNVSDRKRRLFGVACSRRIWHLLTDPRSRRAIDTSERVADGIMDAGVGTAFQGAYLAAADAERVTAAARNSSDPAARAAGLAPFYAALAAHHAGYAEDWYDVNRVSDESSLAALGASWPVGQHTEEFAQVALVRCIFGNPFRTLPRLVTTCLTPAVIGIAETIYQERAFDRLPVLADALEDAGCTNQIILAHCRQPSEHCRGCWVVDLLLGKE